MHPIFLKYTVKKSIPSLISISINPIFYLWKMWPWDESDCGYHQSSRSTKSTWVSKKKSCSAIRQDNNKSILIHIFFHINIKKKYPRARYARPYFQKCYGNFTFSLFLTECSITGSIFTRRLSFLGEEKYSWIFHGQIMSLSRFFSYVGESRIIITPINYNNSYQ